MTLFWLVTLGWNDPRGQASCTASGTLSPDQAAALRTRTDAMPAIIDAGRRSMGIPDGVTATVLFISIEPDALPAAPEPAIAAGGAP
jgi:hypothetical protein